jgi:hypothetical protein
MPMNVLFCEYMHMPLIVIVCIDFIVCEYMNMLLTVFVCICICMSMECIVCVNI